MEPECVDGALEQWAVFMELLEGLSDKDSTGGGPDEAVLGIEVEDPGHVFDADACLSRSGGEKYDAADGGVGRSSVCPRGCSGHRVGDHSGKCYHQLVYTMAMSLLRAKRALGRKLSSSSRQ